MDMAYIYLLVVVWILQVMRFQGRSVNQAVWKRKVDTAKTSKSFQTNRSESIYFKRLYFGALCYIPAV